MINARDGHEPEDERVPEVEEVDSENDDLEEDEKEELDEEAGDD